MFGVPFAALVSAVLCAGTFTAVVACIAAEYLRELDR